MSVANKIVNHSLLNMVGNGTRLMTSFAVGILASRQLGPSSFGQLNLILSYAIPLSFLLTLGFDNSLTYYVSRFATDDHRHRSKAVLKVALVLCVIAGVVSSILATWLVPRFLGEPASTILLLPTLIFIYQTPLWSIAHVIIGFLRGAKEFSPVIVKDQILFPLTHFLGFLIFLKFTSGIMAYTVAYSVATLACVGYASYYMFKVLRTSEWKKVPSQKLTEIPRAEWREWFCFSFPLGVMTGLEPFLMWVTFIVGGMLLSSPDLGYFSVCTRAILISQFLLLALTPIFSPYLAELYKKENHSEFRELFQVTTYWSTKWALLVTFFMAVSADVLLSVFGQAYAAAAMCLLLILPGSAIEASFGIVKQSLVMSGYNRINVVNFVVCIGLNVLFSWLLIPHYGVNGAAAAFSLAYIFLNLFRVVEFYVLLGIAPYSARYLRNLLLMAVPLILMGLMLVEMPISGWTRTAVSALISAGGFVTVFWKDRSLFLGHLAKRRPKPA